MGTVARPREDADLAEPSDAADDFGGDIPLAVAQAAFGGGRTGAEAAARALAEYASCLSGDLAALAPLATTAEQRELLAQEFKRYRAGSQVRMIAYLTGLSRKAGQLIGGPSRYPPPKEGLGAASSLRATELANYRARALAAIKLELRPQPGPMVDGDGDLLAQLRAQLQGAEALHERMKAANSAVRRNAIAGRDAQLAALLEIGMDPIDAGALLVPDLHGHVGFREHRMKNNFSEIARLRRRIAGVQAARAQGMTDERGAGGRIEVVPAARRVRLYLSEQPVSAVRQALQQAGFRNRGVFWQAELSALSIQAAREAAGIAPTPTSEDSKS